MRTSRVRQLDHFDEGSTDERHYQRLSPPPLRWISYQAESIGDVIVVNLDPIRLARVVVRAAVLVGLAVSIASCSGDGSNAPSTTTTTITTTTTTETTAPPATPAPGSPGAPAAPTEKAPRIDPGGPNPFSPTVLAPMAPTAIPGNRENIG